MITTEDHVSLTAASRPKMIDETYRREILGTVAASAKQRAPAAFTVAGVCHWPMSVHFRFIRYLFADIGIA